MTTSPTTVEVIGGIDTHSRTHHAAALNAATGKLLGDQEFPATSKGYAQLLRWLSALGTVIQVGMEGTGSYGAGLCRFLQTRGITVTEVARPNRQTRRLHGKSDPLDAIAAARAVLAETATTVPKLRTGPVEAIRVLHVTRASAIKARKAAINQMHGLLASAPEPLRVKLAGPGRAALVKRCGKLRPGGSPLTDPSTAVKAMLKTLARRIDHLDAEIADLDGHLDELTATTAPTLRAVHACSTHVTAQLLITAGENAPRITSEAALARLCGIAPIPVGSGANNRYRLHRGGDRQANRAIHMVVVNRLRWDPRTQAYSERRTADGKSKKDIIRCLKRAVIRELYRALITDLTSINSNHDSTAVAA